CTGFVEGLTSLLCAGMAAVRAALGCGARMIEGLASLTTGIVTLASIWIGFRSGFGSGLGILILGGSYLISSLGETGGWILGGSGSFTFSGGCGVVGTINTVSSYLCSSITFLAVAPM